MFSGTEFEGYDMHGNSSAGTNFSVVPVYVRTNPNRGFGIGQIYTNFFVQVVCLIGKRPDRRPYRSEHVGI